MVNDGIAYSFGVIMEPMRADLGVGVGSISLVGGVLAGVTMLTGPLAAAFVNRSHFGIFDLPKLSVLPQVWKQNNLYHWFNNLISSYFCI